MDDAASRNEKSTRIPIGKGIPVPSGKENTVVERDKYQLAELDRIERTKPTSNVKQRDSFSSQLLYPADYRDDLLIIESERDIRSPRLSSDFLKKHINAEQRRLVVNFLLHLGTHCRYSTHAVYESVKLFDVVMDKMSVDTAFIQMSALASLWIILKKQQNFDDIPTATTMVSYAKELYAGREDLLKEYERKILQALNFNLTFADPYSMLAHHLNRLWSYLHLSDQTMTFLYNCGCYLIDITLLDEHFCRMYANLLVLTVTELVLGLVLDTVVVDASPRWLFWRSLIISDAAHLIGWFREEEIDRTRVKILQCLLDSRKKLYNVVYKKYSRTRHGRVAKSFFERATNLSIAETFHDT
ncbi:unnamed protein product [Xylocopa violacea]|uniref:Cyclin N-terminal domain-containing protein n=1 Tax=Xylocopa violacea TaxID=135666 RepID=A0ABP1P7J7_XYLVO